MVLRECQKDRFDSRFLNDAFKTNNIQSGKEETDVWIRSYGKSQFMHKNITFFPIDTQITSLLKCFKRGIYVNAIENRILGKYHYFDAFCRNGSCNRTYQQSSGSRIGPISDRFTRASLCG